MNKPLRKPTRSRRRSLPDLRSAVPVVISPSKGLPKRKKNREKNRNVVDLGRISGEQVVDLRRGNVFTASVIGLTVIYFSHMRKGSSYLFQIKNGSNKVFWSDLVKWSGGVRPCLSNSGVDFVGFTCSGRTGPLYGVLVRNGSH